VSNTLKSILGILSAVIGLCILVLIHSTNFIAPPSKKVFEVVGEVILIAGVWYLLIRFRHWIDDGNE
jgi:hypothetical protein